MFTEENFLVKEIKIQSQSLKRSYNKWPLLTWPLLVAKVIIVTCEGGESGCFYKKDIVRTYSLR